jgi:hypothetical protein
LWVIRVDIAMSVLTSAITNSGHCATSHSITSSARAIGLLRPRRDGGAATTGRPCTGSFLGQQRVRRALGCLAGPHRDGGIIADRLPSC